MNDLRELLPHCSECLAVGEPSEHRHRPWCSRAADVEEVIAVPPAPRCELCGVPFDPSAPAQTCGGMPCLVPENEIIDWVMRVRAQPTVASPLGRWPAPALAKDLLEEQGQRLAVIAGELARDLGASLVPQVGPYCPSYVRRVPPLKLEPRELEIMQRGWHQPSAARSAEQLAELDGVWARVAKHVLETICDRLQAEFR